MNIQRRQKILAHKFFKAFRLSLQTLVVSTGLVACSGQNMEFTSQLQPASLTVKPDLGGEPLNPPPELPVVVTPPPVVVTPPPPVVVTPPPVVVTPPPVVVTPPPVVVTPPPPVVVTPPPVVVTPPPVVVTPPPPLTVTQKFTQSSAPGKADVLFVIDNALSMIDVQAEAANRLSTFLGLLGGIDWQIGVTTTDVSTGVYGVQGSLVPLVGASGGQKILKPTTNNAQQILSKTIVRPETISCGFSPTNPCASPWVQPLRATILAVQKRNSDNANFFRADSDFITIVLSNKDEMRTGTNNNPTQPVAVINEVQKTWGTTKTFKSYGLVILPKDPQCLSTQKKIWNFDPSPADFMESLTSLTGGKLVSLCESDYTENMTEVAAGIRRQFRSVELSSMPVIGSVKVTLTPAQPSITYTVSGTTIRFSDFPVAGTEVSVEYLPQ